MSKAASIINFYFKKPVTLKNRRSLKAFIASLLKTKATKTGNINYIFCSDEELLEINRNFLQHDYYTDIITFELSDKNDPNIEAEIYISVDRVRDNAGLAAQAFNAELHRVIFHGILHLCGHKDKTTKEREEMRKEEDMLIYKYFNGKDSAIL